MSDYIKIKRSTLQAIGAATKYMLNKPDVEQMKVTDIPTGILSIKKDDASLNRLGVILTERISTEINESDFGTDGPPAKIGENTFYNYTTLEKVSIPDKINQIERGAFNGCTGIKELSLPFVGETADPRTYNHLGHIFGAKNVSENDILDDYSLLEVKVKGGYIGERAFYKCSNVRYIYIGDTVSYVDDNAFEGLSLNVINDTVRGLNFLPYDNVPRYVRSKYGDTTSVTIPDTVKFIGPRAFQNDTSLEYIVLPSQLRKVGYNAFDGCTNLNKNRTFIYDEDGVLQQGNSYLSGDSTDYFYLIEGRRNDDINGTCKFIGYKAYYERGALGTITIPDSVRCIGESAFENETFNEGYGDYQQKIDKLWFSSNSSFYLDEIGNFAFYGCGINTIHNFPTVHHIGKRAFAYNDFVNLTIPGYVIRIEDSAFAGCSKLQSITFEDIHSDYYGITNLSDGMFAGCESLRVVNLPETLNRIGDYAFDGCFLMKDITIPDKVDYLGENSFTNCESLEIMRFNSLIPPTFKEGSIPSNIKQIVVRDEVATNPLDGREYSVENLYKAALVSAFGIIEGGRLSLKVTTRERLELTPEDFAGMTTITKNMYANNSTLSYVELPNTITTIEDGAFAGCINLETVIVPDSVTSIGRGILEGCSSLKSLTLPYLGNGNYAANSDGTHILGYTFGPIGTGYTDHDDVVPQSLKTLVLTKETKLYDDALRSCGSITDITIPVTCTTFSTNCFKGCLFENVYYNGTANDWASIKKINSYSSPLQGARLYADGSLLTHATVSTLNSYAFHRYSYLESVDFTGTTISSSALYGCKNLGHLYVTDNIQSVAQNALTGCDNLLYNVTDGCSYLGSTSKPYIYLAKGANTTSASIKTTCRVIGYNAFDNCTSVETVTIGEKLAGSDLKSISSNAFTDTSIKTLYIWASIPPTLANEYVFPGTLETIVVNGEYANDYRQSWSNYDYMITVPALEIPIDATSIKAKDFEGIIEIPIGAFKNYTNLKYVEIPNTVKTIGYGAFEGCTALEEMVLPFVGKDADVKADQYGDYYEYQLSYLFAGNILDDNSNVPQSLSTITLTDVNKLAPYALSRSHITTINLNSRLTDIPAYAFYDCERLVNVNFGYPDELVSIGEFAFFACGFTEFTVPDNVNTLGNGAFSPLEKFTLPAKSGVFNGLKFYLYNLRTLITTSGTEIPDEIFYGNTTLQSVTLANTITRIGVKAFRGCTSLTEIDIPASVTTIDKQAFCQCKNISRVTFNQNSKCTTIGESAFEECTSLSGIALPNSLITIGKWAFFNCTSLQAISFPEKVASIGGAAFKGCKNLATIKSYNPYPPTLEDYYTQAGHLSSVFPSYNPSKYALNRIEVKAGSVSLYKNNKTASGNGWYEWAEIIIGTL